ncbi:T9SS type A sorting domain-containing protein [candidate division KSB1 bacterium]|nr:T9SS type A sorting domain-containing protein [candidate division KSB1 bacterium]
MKQVLFFLGVLLMARHALSQVNTLDRRYVPVTYKTAARPLFELNVNEWTAYRFDRATKSWSAIPFQFDQLTDTDRYDRNKDDLTDATDEMIFLPTDTGDKAELSDWITDEMSRQAERIELQLTDPLNPSKQGWIYLFKNVMTKPKVQNYIDYIPGPPDQAAADTIVTTAFKLGHSKNGWIDYLKFTGGKNDFIDRFKLRLKGEGILVPPYEINEDFVQAETGDDVVAFYPGPVRLFHISRADILLEKLNLPIISKPSPFEYNYEYTPYSFAIEAETDIDASLLAIFGVRLIRQSLDFNNNAVGMTFYSANNPNGVLIDGVATSYSDALNQSERENWVMATGDHGTVFLIFNITIMKNSRRRIYFHDEKNNSNTGDMTQNTGDSFSIGDMGVMIEATGDALITNRLAVTYKGYFIDRANVNFEFGEQLLAWEQNPLNVTAVLQMYDPTGIVESEPGPPDDFQLYSTYPNPYHLNSAARIRFEFGGSVNNLYDIVVYNVIGQKVVEFKNLAVNANGRHVVLWDARDANGLLTAPGVYFVQLDNGIQTLTQKLIISR